MKRNLIQRVAVGILFGLATLFVSSERADAAFVAWVCNDAACSGGGDVSLADGAVGDGSGITGVISFNTTFDGYELVVNLAQSKPALSNGMDLNYTVLNVAGTDAGSPIWLFAVDTGFTGAPAIAGHLGGTNPLGGATTTLYLCDGDAVGNWSPCVTDVFTGPEDFVANAVLPISANPYTLTIGVGISGVAPGDTATGDLRAAAIPEPASLSLLGLGLAGVRAAVRRRRKQ